MRAIYSRAAAASGLLLVFTTWAQPQPFSNLKNSEVNYAAAAAEPRMTCEALPSAFKDADIVSVAARAIANTADAPAHCRISGVLAPEIGFEVNLPAKWNERLYMIGNGR